MKRIATLLLVLLVFRLIPVGGPVAATTVRALGLDGLVATADRIVAGTVIGSEAYWTPDGKLILTRHRIAVDETLKGPPSGEVEVTTVGGTVGDVTLHVSGMAAFRDGERTVVFIESSGGYSTVVGLAQGKFSVGGDGRAANDLGGLDFIGPVNPGPFVIDYALFRSLILERVRPF
jgi:hypothetical protein